jgi:hypothetical protein
MFAAPAEGTLKHFMEFAETGFADHEQSPPNQRTHAAEHYAKLIDRKRRYGRFRHASSLPKSKCTPSNLTPRNLPLSDATRYLQDRVAKEGQHAGDEIAAGKVAEELGYLPLALEQAAAFIIKLRWSFDQYRQYFGEARPELLNYQAEGGSLYLASVAKTWSMTLQRLSRWPARSCTSPPGSRRITCRAASFARTTTLSRKRWVRK